ncbi:MAG: hypothetical protein M3Y86_07270 [Verrucomicrobiota bacterium]|nr:hypothetical protein [Verrucomicrobiota bacterium]
MRIILLLALLCGCAALAPRASAQTKTKIVPNEWLPALSPSIDNALRELKETDTQGAMNQLSRNIADLTDAQLFIAYVRLYEKLPAKERAKLFEEQAQWLKKRPMIAKAGVESKGGSLAPLEANNAEVTYAEKRLKELRARLKAKGDDE